MRNGSALRLVDDVSDDALLVDRKDLRKWSVLCGFRRVWEKYFCLHCKTNAADIAETHLSNIAKTKSPTHAPAMAPPDFGCQVLKRR